MRTIVIIPAAGKGKRVGNTLPKQFLTINGKELLAYTIDVFEQSKFIDDIIIATNKEYYKHLDELQTKYLFSKVSDYVEGGNERQDTVYNALKHISANDEDLIVVHDAARPLLPQDTLQIALEVAKMKGSALVCVKAKDTLLHNDNGNWKYPNRDTMYNIQTPQIFRYGELLDAYEKAMNEGFYGTDDSMLMKRAGYEVHLVEGSLINFKITTPEDIILFKRIISNR